MFPLDDEAKEISARYESVWKASPDEDVAYGKRIVDRVQEEQAAIDAKASTVKIEGLPEILQQMTAMMEQNAALIASLVSAKTSERRV